MIRVIQKVNRFDYYRNKSAAAANQITETNVRNGVGFLRSIMPRKTGAMIDSTEVVVTERSFGRVGWGVRIGVPYYKFVDEGTIYIEGQHFIPRAIQAIRDGLDTDFRNFESFLR